MKKTKQKGRGMFTLEEVRLRPLLDTAIADVEEIENLAFCGDIAHPSYRPWTPREIYDFSTAAGFTSLVARVEPGYENDHVLGWVNFVQEVQDGHQAVRIHRLAVHPSSWNRGIGTKLLDQVTVRARVWVHQLDQRGFDFFSCNGFTVTVNSGPLVLLHRKPTRPR